MLERIGQHVVHDRALFVMDVQRPDEICSLPGRLGKHFACLLVWDADVADDATIARVADALLRAGAVYVCAWGRDCERVHDIVDSVLVKTAVASDSDAMLGVITTWHSEESLADATWFLLFTAHPDDAYFSTCTSSLAITVGAPARADEIHRAFLDPEAFSAEVAGRE
jgi:hypothetical protein